MTMNVSLPSAKIYQFPVGGRRGLPGYRPSIQSTAEQAEPHQAITGWYHEAAIEEAKRGSEH
jgi:hypothetical protein